MAIGALSVAIDKKLRRLAQLDTGDRRRIIASDLDKLSPADSKRCDLVVTVDPCRAVVRRFFA